MTWKRLDVVFILKSPLHLGYLPSKGMVIAPTRHYVPGKNLWGAITKRATENLFSNPNAASYHKISESIKNNFRFTYLYLYDGNTIYVPKYTEEGLMYGNKEKMDVLEFENKFIGSRILTKIDHNRGTTEDQSLHEIEFLRHIHRDEENRTRNTRIIGCIWVRDTCELATENGIKEVKITDEGLFIDGFNLIKKLVLGGERNYGFGVVDLESVNSVKFQVIDISDENDVRISKKKSEPIYFHFKYDKNIPFKGEIELVGGKEYPQDSKSERNIGPGHFPSKPQYYFSPGTIIEREIQFVLMWNGTAIASC